MSVFHPPFLAPLQDGIWIHKYTWVVLFLNCAVLWEAWPGSQALQSSAGPGHRSIHSRLRYSCGSWCLQLVLGFLFPRVLSSFSYVWLCNFMVCSPPVSSVHRILQARILEWVAKPSSRGSSWSRDWTRVSCIFCIIGGFFICCFFTFFTSGKPLFNLGFSLSLARCSGASWLLSSLTSTLAGTLALLETVWPSYKSHLGSRPVLPWVSPDTHRHM